MPQYFYECEDGHKFNLFLAISQHKSEVACEQCHKNARTVIQPVRTTGWYQREGWEDDMPMDV